MSYEGVGTYAMLTFCSALGAYLARRHMINMRGQTVERPKKRGHTKTRGGGQRGNNGGTDKRTRIFEPKREED